MQMPPVPGQQEPGQTEPTPDVFQPTGDVAPAAEDGGVGLPVAGQPGAVAPEAPVSPPVQFSDLANAEAQGGSAQVEAAAAAPAVPVPPTPEVSPFPASEGEAPLPETVPLSTPAEAPVGDAQGSAEQARAATTEHLDSELKAVGSDMDQGEAPALPPQEIGAAPVAPPSPVDVALPPEPPSEPIEPTAEATPVAPEMPPSETQQLINEADELVKVGEHNSARMREIMARLRELQGQETSPANPLETGQSINQAG